MGKKMRGASLLEFKVAIFEVFYVPLIFPSAAHWESVCMVVQSSIFTKDERQSHSVVRASFCEVHPTPRNCN